MSTTTLRLPDELKTRIAVLAERCGKSAHSIMLEAIAEKVDEAELRMEFQQVADARMKALMASGRGIDWHEMRAYLQARAEGEEVRAPKARSWRK